MDSIKKLPKINRNIILGIFLLIAIAFSVVTIVMATAPDPGHNFTEASGGMALGGLLYGSAADTLLQLSGNITTAKQFLSQTGTGAVSAAPIWSALTSADVGLSSVENTALSTWVGSTNITTLGTIGAGTWNADAIADGKIASALTGKTYNALTLTAVGTGFTIAGGTVSKTLTVTGDATISGTPLADPMTTIGDIIIRNGSNVTARLVGAAGFLKGNVSTAPTWSTINLGASADVGTSILPTANGGTGIAYFTAAGPTTARVYTFPDVATTILTDNADVTVAQGGTGLAATADDAVFVGDSTSAVTARTLPSCSGATTDKLLYNISTNTFSCGVDQTGGGTTDVQSFTATGAGTWTKPTGFTPTFVEVVMWGGGGGGGAGASLATAVVAKGGAGGGGGAFVRRIYRASDLGATENLNVGVGGTAGAPGVAGAAGGSGGIGGNSTFGTTVMLSAFGGGGGMGGQISALASGGGGGGGTGGAGGTGSTAVGAGGLPGTSNVTGVTGGTGSQGPITVVTTHNAENGGGGGGGSTAVPASVVGGGSIFGGGGGGTGGHHTAVPAVVAPSAGGRVNAYIAAGGGAAGTSGATPTVGTDGAAGNSTRGGAGGGGGGSTVAASTAGAAGGAGGIHGGGGGGGGVGMNSGLGGAGGAGGRGAIFVYTW